MAQEKVIRKNVKISKHELVESQKVDLDYPKWKLKIAKLLKLDLAQKYQYCFRIQYTSSTRLKMNDVICNDQGVLFAVLREQNRIAMIVTPDSFVEKPKVWGTFKLVEKPKKQPIK